MCTHATQVGAWLRRIAALELHRTPAAATAMADDGAVKTAATMEAATKEADFEGAVLQDRRRRSSDAAATEAEEIAKDLAVALQVGRLQTFVSS